MKTARLLLASLSLAVLTACGSESITAPVAPGAASRNITPTEADTTTTTNLDNPTERIPLGCTGRVVVRINEVGVTLLECVLDERGPTMGSGT